MALARHNNPKWEFRTTDTGYRISIESESEYFKFNRGISILAGYMKIAEILGCKNLDESGRSVSEGCDTCDFGWKYSLDLDVW
jgi:hypothetical protein